MSWHRGRSISSTYSNSSLSSPPPLSPVQFSSNARIRSSYSPVLGSERGIHASDPDDIFDGLYCPNSPEKSASGSVSLPSFRSLFGDLKSDLSESVIEPPSDDEEIDLASPSYDAEDELDIEHDLSNKHYRVSSERGRWKTDPVPVLFQRQRLSSLSGPVVPPEQSTSVTRPNSEPAEAHSTASQCLSSALENLGSTSHVKDDLVLMQSPLPPSSPPLSPISSFVSPILDAISPLELSSPSFPSSSSILECPPLEADFVLDDSHEPTSSSGPTTPKEFDAAGSTYLPDLESQSQKAASTTCELVDMCSDVSPQGAATAFQNLDPDHGATTSSSPLISGDQMAVTEKMDVDVEERHHALTPDTSEDNRESDEAVEDLVDSDPEPSRKSSLKRKENTVDKDLGGRRKKARIEASPAETSNSATSNKSSKKPHTKRSVKKRTVESDDETDAEDEPSFSSGFPQLSDARHHSSPPPSDPDSELTGLLIEALATSRASSLPISSLYKTLMQSRPSLKEQKTKKEWFEVFLTVLSRGNRSGRGVFGKVESSGKDSANRPLESQWFYIPENDHDQDRAALIRSMMPRPAKRSETKKYKQYYYQPLGKISRWDPEDDL